MSELASLIYEVEHNSCKRIGEDRYKRINQRIGYLQAQTQTAKEISAWYIKRDKYASRGMLKEKGYTKEDFRKRFLSDIGAKP